MVRRVGVRGRVRVSVSYGVTCVRWVDLKYRRKFNFCS